MRNAGAQKKCDSQVRVYCAHIDMSAVAQSKASAHSRQVIVAAAGGAILRVIGLPALMAVDQFAQVGRALSAPNELVT